VLIILILLGLSLEMHNLFLTSINS